MYKKRPTMGDVARLSGVSQTTVSFVINDTPNANISEKTRAAVLKAVEELGYKPNTMAVSLRKSQSRVIGLVTDEIATTPFGGQIVTGAQDAARENQRMLMFMDLGNVTRTADEEIDILLGRQVDAIIFATMRHRVIKPSELLYQVPSVLLDCRDADNALPSVVPDEFLGAYQGIEALLQRNHRRIGMINTSEAVPASQLREQGYRQALADHGIIVEEGMVAYGEDGNSKTGYDGVKALFSRYADMTALFCFNDRVAMGAYDALRQMNKRIPEDVAVMGFDNYELIAASLHPKLTTMQLPLYEMGRWAVETVLELSQKNPKKGSSQQLMLPCPLILRDSI